MTFAHPLSWWAAALVAAALAAVASLVYRRPLSPLPPIKRRILIALRTATLAAIVVFLLRPIALVPPAAARGAIVPVLVDASRSMRLADANDAGTQSRVAQAAALLRTELVPALAREYRPEIFAAGDGLAPADADHLAADARRSNLTGAIAAARDRYRGQRVAGIILLSDGADTSDAAPGPLAAGGPPVFTVGIGSASGVADREVLSVAASDPRLDESSIDLQVSAISTGFGRTPFAIRVLANGRVLESRRVVPPADGSPVDETFTVSPDLSTATVYTAEIPAERIEAVTENNTRSVLVSPAGRRRRVLVLEGAPGFEHSFMTRALARDPGVEVDSVVRKGQNAEGRDTFFVQAAGARTAALLAGFPARREELFAYDAVVVANVEGEFFTRAQLAALADFVGERGGGLLVLGARSFGAHGLAGTPLEEVLPVELNDRRSGLVRTSLDAQAASAGNKLSLTADGETHPVMRVGATRDETTKIWAALPPLASSVPLGGSRPGATVLAVTRASGGALMPLVAVQRYGRGRSMIFAGEAAWRWKMLLSSSDRTYEYFWRQAVRWLARPSPDPVAVDAPDAAEPGDTAVVSVDARDAAFVPVADAVVEATLDAPDGTTETLKLRRSDAAAGRATAAIRLDQPGLYRVSAEARTGSTRLGAADRFFYVGGSDREFAAPRLNEGFLRRLARTTGGRYVHPRDAGRIVSWLQESAPQHAPPEQRDLWHTPWAFALASSMLAAEWILRRRWGLR